jgi:hypothetical protein
MKVRQTDLVRLLIRAAGIHPNLESCDLGGMLLLEDDPKAIFQDKAFAHRRAKLTPPTRIGKGWLSLALELGRKAVLFLGSR